MHGFDQWPTGPGAYHRERPEDIRRRVRRECRRVRRKVRMEYWRIYKINRGDQSCNASNQAAQNRQSASSKGARNAD